MSVVHDLRRQPELMERIATRFSSGEDMDPRQLWQKLWRHKTVIAGTTFVLTLLAVVLIFQLTPRYTSSAYVMVDPRRTHLVDVEAVLSGLSPDAETIQSEVEVLRSRGLALKTILKLGLDLDPEFNSALRQPTFMQKLFSLRTYLPDSWLPSPPDDDLLPDERMELEQAGVIDAFLDRLSVAAQGRSRVIRVSFESEDPRKAADAANTLADYYIVAQLDAKFEATQRANAWLSEKVEDMRQQVVAAERAVEEFRAEAGLVQSGDSTVANAQLSELSTELIRARAERTEVESRLASVEAALRSGGVESIPEVLSSPLIQRLREQQSEVARRIADLSQQYGELHPRMVSARAEAADIETKIRLEIDKVIAGIRAEVASARAREATLAGSVNNLKREAGELGKSEVQLRALEREAAAARTLLETFLARAKEVGSEGSFQQADAQIISRAEIPTTPSYPKKTILLGMSFFGSLLVGVMIAFILELMDRGFRSSEQIEQAMAAAPLGLVPSLGGLRNLGRSPEDYVLEKPTSAFAESIRSLRTSLLLSDVDRPPKVVLVSSSVPREGKTSVTVALGRLMASVGQRVLVIDCDLRRPKAHRVLGLQQRPGVVDYFAGEAPLADIIQQDPKSPLHLIAAGRPAPNPPDLLGSDQMRTLLRDMAERYDFVLIDSAPVLAVSDTKMLCRLVDKTIFLVRWADTRREVATNGLRQLREAGAGIAGVVLTLVDVRKHARYGYSDSGYYYGKARKYYTG